MVYAILLDDDQEAGSDVYIVRTHGSLADCRRQTVYDAARESWAKSEYEEISSEPKTLTDGLGAEYVGQIVGFRVLADSSVRVAARDRPPRRYAAALAMLGIAIGGTLAYRRKRLPRPPRGGA